MARVERPVQLHGLLQVAQRLVANVEQGRARLGDGTGRRLLHGRRALLAQQPAALRLPVLDVQLRQARRSLFGPRRGVVAGRRVALLRLRLLRGDGLDGGRFGLGGLGGGGRRRGLLLGVGFGEARPDRFGQGCEAADVVVDLVDLVVVGQRHAVLVFPVVGGRRVLRPVVGRRVRRGAASQQVSIRGLRVGLLRRLPFRIAELSVQHL